MSSNLGLRKQKDIHTMEHETEIRTIDTPNDIDLKYITHSKLIQKLHTVKFYLQLFSKDKPDSKSTSLELPWVRDRELILTIK